MNQPLNYEIDGTQYYYELDTSKWYTINKDNTISYINRWYDNMSYVYDTMTYYDTLSYNYDNLSHTKQINTYRE